MNKIIVLTVIESLYLLYMYFVFKTSYSFSGASLEKETQGLGALFVHDTGHYENKVCLFGKIMAIIAVMLAILRAYLLDCCPTYKKSLFWATVGFDITCLSLAYIMNLNALFYVLPLIFIEAYILLIE